MLQYFDYERSIHAIKTALACLLGLIVANFMPFHADQWLIITIIVVMCAQLNVGSMLSKSSMRFIGTLTGSLVAAFTLICFGANPAVTAAVIAIASVIFSYIATGTNRYSDAGTLGAVTIAVILLGQSPTMVTALQRFIEITLGIIVAALVSQFILPIRARDHLQRTQAQTIEKIQRYYSLIFVKHEQDADLHELDEAIVKSLSAQRSLAAQAKREPFGVAFDPVYFSKLLRCEKEVLRSMSCMHYVGDMLPADKNILLDMPVVQHFHQVIFSAFGAIAQGIHDRRLDEVTLILPSVQPIKDTLNELRHTVHIDDIIYLDGFAFCAEILVVQLTEMVVLLKKKFGTKKRVKENKAV
jgi:uncharacterized membrane protein YccC